MSAPFTDPRAAAAEANTPNLNTLWARVLVDELIRAGLEQVVISPGSRSAPLVFQFAASPEITDHSVIDERSAAFFALGLARAGGKPVALLCTTGTAAANYVPAVCEAERDGIPLLVMTAARPAEDHDCGTQQVMDQTRLYGSHVRAFHALPQPELNAGKLAALRTLAARAWTETRFPQPGPVHLDIPFRKPLEPVSVGPDHRDHVPDELDAALLEPVRGRAGRRPWLEVHAPRTPPEPAVADALAREIEDSRRPLILAGAHPAGERWRRSLRTLAEAAGIPVLAAPQSGLRHWDGRGENVLSAGDLLAEGGFYARCGLPDLVLQLGHAPLGWALQELLRAVGNARHLVISDRPALHDPEHRACRQFIGDPELLITATLERLAPAERNRQRWLAAHRRAQDQALDILEKELDGLDELTAPGIWHRIGKRLPAGSALVTSSSMVVRDLECFMAGAGQSLEVHFNRGLNGIDGVVATALGVACARRRRGIETPTLLVIGDVALRHDLGSLPLAAELGLDLGVVVIDNDGGEIFDYLPGAVFPEIHRRHFTTPRGTPISAHLPRSVEFESPATAPQFDEALSRALTRGGMKVVHAATSRSRDQQLRARLRDALGRLHAGGHLSGT